mmetsp:Transcript_30220/g.104410  ORF Transcript_30220/g.104410 Transcript_30220/m.104410 type:complete len:340 (+) Transcript_30220:645-1664(+)
MRHRLRLPEEHRPDAEVLVQPSTVVEARVLLHDDGLDVAVEHGHPKNDAKEVKVVRRGKVLVEEARAAEPRVERKEEEEHGEAGVFVKRVQNELAVAPVVGAAVVEHQSLQEPKLRNGKVAGVDGLAALEARNPDADLRRHDHVHVVGPVSNGQSHGLGSHVVLDEVHKLRLLLRGHAHREDGAVPRKQPAQNDLHGSIQREEHAHRAAVQNQRRRPRAVRPAARGSLAARVGPAAPCLEVGDLGLHRLGLGDGRGAPREPVAERGDVRRGRRITELFEEARRGFAPVGRRAELSSVEAVEEELEIAAVLFGEDVDAHALRDEAARLCDLHGRLALVSR